jgi:general stress protein 26
MTEIAQYSWQKSNLDDVLRDFTMAQLEDLYAGDQPSRPVPIKLDEYPAQMVSDALDNRWAHPLITMSHLDKNGYPFMSVMGFSFLDGKVHITSRPNALKQRRLEKDPRCCVIYHNNIPRPDQLACITLVGKARISNDREQIHRANVAVAHKNYHDDDPDVERREPAIAAHTAAKRELIILDEVEAVYVMTPMAKGTGSGIPNPVVSWRADRAPRS